MQLSQVYITCQFSNSQVIISYRINILCNVHCGEEISANYIVVTNFKNKSVHLSIFPQSLVCWEERGKGKEKMKWLGWPKWVGLRKTFQKGSHKKRVNQILSFDLNIYQSAINFMIKFSYQSNYRWKFLLSVMVIKGLHMISKLQWETDSISSLKANQKINNIIPPQQQHLVSHRMTGYIA